MLQHHTPDDYVLSTGLLHSIKDLLNVSFNYVGIKDWEKYIKINKDFYRPAEVDVLIGNSTKAQNVLNWKPKTSFNEMVMKMVDNDLKIVYNK
jgi:GDPmannose 4,6-dehydratase